MPRSEDGRKRGRLSRSGDFDRVYRDGRSHANRFLVLYAFPREENAEGGHGPVADDAEGGAAGAAGVEEAQDVRLGISVSRKVGGAVERNAVKRALREAFWSLDERTPPGYDFVLVARPDVAALVERDGANGVEGALRELFSEAGIGPA